MEERNLVLRIKNCYELLDPAERRVAEYFLQRVIELPYATLEEVSKRVCTSKTTIERFCKKLGYFGFKDLKAAVIKDVLSASHSLLAGVDIPGDVGPEISAAELIDAVTRFNIEVLLEIKNTLKEENIDLAVQIIERSRGLLLVGVGSSAPVIFDAEQRFTRLGINCYASSDPHFQVVRALSLGAEDAVFAVSYSGRTRDIVDCLRVAKSKGAKIVCLTSFPKSPVSAFADCVLYSPGRRANLPGESIASRISQLAIIDIICAKIYLDRQGKIEEYLKMIEESLSKKRVS